MLSFEMPSIGFAPYNQKNKSVERWRTTRAIAVSEKLQAKVSIAPASPAKQSTNTPEKYTSKNWGPQKFGDS